MGRMSEISAEVEAESRPEQRLDPRDDDPTREGMWRSNRCGYCDNGRKPCKQGRHNHCSNPIARND